MFAGRLREILQSRKMTQAELARLIEVSPGTLSSYLHEGEGRKVPTLDTLYRISEKLDVSIGWLCGESPAQNTLLTYADLLTIIIKLCEADSNAPWIAFVENGPADSAEPCAGISTTDPTIVEFMIGYKKVSALLSDGIIDHEMYDAWIQKKLRDYAKHMLDGTELPF